MQTVVGMYKTVSEANQVKQALLGEGYSGGDVTVIDQSESGYGNQSESGYGSGSRMTGTTGTTGTGVANAAESVGGKIKNFFENLTGHDEDMHRSYTEGVSGGGALVAVNVAEGEVDRAAAVLRQYGAQDIQGGSGAGYGQTSGKANYGATGSNVTGEQVIPVVEEELVVGKREVERGGVRVFSRVVSTPVSESVSLHDERVVVDRRPVDRPASAADFTDAGPIEVRAMGEEAVVGKASRVVEEVVVGKQASERTETVQDSVRRTEVDVEQVATGVSTDKTTGMGTKNTSNKY